MSSSSGNSRAENSARKPVLFVQRRSGEGPGAFAEVLGECGLAWRCVRLQAGDVLPKALEDWSLVVVLGDHAGAAADGGGGAHAPLFDLLTSAVKRDFPTIGIGAGAELLLEAATSSPQQSRGLDVGWQPVALTDAGRSDKALAHLPASFPGFHWHRHIGAVPEGAIVLAATDSRPCQAFRMGQNVYGFCFHPEITGWMVGRWIDSRPTADGDPGRAERLATVHRETAENADGSRQRLRDLLRGLLPALGVVPDGMGPVVNRSIE